MHLSESAKARVGLALILGISAALFALHVRHAAGDRESLQTFLSGIFVPTLFALGVFAGGLWLRRRGMDGERVLRVAGWCVLGAVALTGEAALMTLYQQGEGVEMSHEFYVFVNAASGGAAVGFVVGFYDSRQRVARETSARLNRQLSVLNRVLRHDIRTNANLIHGNAELLAEDVDDPVERAQTIQEQSADLVKMGNQAREIERLLQEGDAATEPVDIASLVEATCDRVAQKHPEAVIDVSFPDEMVVRAHPLVESALRNVVENAVEHNDKETARVAIEPVDASRPGTDLVGVRIADNGPGIPDGEREVLERGYETPLEHASGLGLWLVNWIVAESDGRIRFEENDPEGSVIRLCFERAHAVPSDRATSVPVAGGAPS
jgi:signal transduction histidine kinase